MTGEKSQRLSLLDASARFQPSAPRDSTRCHCRTRSNARGVAVMPGPSGFQNVSRGGVPQDDARLEKTGGERSPVRGEGQFPDGAPTAVDRAFDAAGGHVPKVDLAVMTAHGKGLTVGRKDDGRHACIAALECSTRAIRAEIPQDHGRIVAARRQRGTNRREKTQAKSPELYGREGGPSAPSHQIPEENGFIQTPRSQSGAIARERDTGHRSLVTPEHFTSPARELARRLAANSNHRVAAAGQGPASRSETSARSWVQYSTGTSPASGLRRHRLCVGPKLPREADSPARGGAAENGDQAESGPETEWGDIPEVLSR